MAFYPHVIRLAPLLFYPIRNLEIGVPLRHQPLHIPPQPVPIRNSFRIHLPIAIRNSINRKV